MSSFDLYLNLSLVFFLLLTVLNYRAHRSVLYPPFIFCAMWLLDLLVFRLGLIEINPLHGNTLAIVAAGAASFSIGGFLAGLAPRALLRTHLCLFSPKPQKVSESFRTILMICLLCGLPVMSYQTLKLSQSQGGGFSLMQARVATIEAYQNGDASGSFSDVFTRIALVTPFLFAIEKKDRKFWVVTVGAFIVCILSTGRGILLSLISGLSAIYILQTKQESLRGAMRFLRWPMALFATLWIGLIFTNKDTEEMTGGVAGIATSFVLSYIAGPLAAFDGVVQRPADYIMTASHLFQFPLRLAAALHLITDYARPPLIDSFVQVPFPMNVYTVFKFSFLELGIIGTIVLMLFVGLLHSLLYLKARQGGSFFIYLFAFSIYSVLMVIFDDCYLDVGSYLRVIAFGLLCSFIGPMQFRLFTTRQLSLDKQCYGGLPQHPAEPQGRSL
jgi:oligosaccharide repeat unit polymerase